MTKARNTILAALLTFGPACASSAYDTEAPAVAQTTTCDGLQTSAAHEALLTPSNITHSRPIYEYEGRALLRRVVGAEVVVPASKGDSAAYLERLGRCEAARMAGRDDDHPLAVEGVDVQVIRSGPNFVVRLTSDEREKGRDIVDRVERLRDADPSA